MCIRDSLSYTLYDHLPESKSPIVNFKALAQPILVTALAGATLTATNLLVSVAARSIAGVAPNDRASLIALSELPARGQQLLDLIPQLVITQEPIASTPAKLMILLSLATLLVPTSRRQLKYSAVAVSYTHLDVYKRQNMPRSAPALHMQVAQQLS